MRSHTLTNLATNFLEDQCGKKNRTLESSLDSPADHFGVWNGSSPGVHFFTHCTTLLWAPGRWDLPPFSSSPSEVAPSPSVNVCWMNTLHSFLQPSLLSDVLHTIYTVPFPSWHWPQCRAHLPCGWDGTGHPAPITHPPGSPQALTQELPMAHASRLFCRSWHLQRDVAKGHWDMDTGATKCFSGKLEENALGKMHLFNSPWVPDSFRIVLHAHPPIIRLAHAEMESQGHLMPTSVNAILVLRRHPLFSGISPYIVAKKIS